MHIPHMFYMVLICICTAQCIDIAEYRAQPLKIFLEQYQRGATILELDAHVDSPSLRFHKQFDRSVFILMTENTAVTDICKEKDIKNITVLTTPPKKELLLCLAECEHFDIVTAYTTMTTSPENYFEMLDAILRLGEITIIEIPTVIKNHALSLGGTHITSNKQANTEFFVFQKQKTSIQRPSWHSPRVEHIYRISSSKQNKALYHIQKNRYSYWHAGINLTTFRALHGTWPTSEMLSLQLANFDDASDLILQGTTLIEN
jgi:hypothetical protein